LRLGILLVLFDVYITWARIEKSNATNGGTDVVSTLTEMPILGQYLFFLTMNVLATVAQHGIIRILARYLLARPKPKEDDMAHKSPSSSEPKGQDHVANGPSLASPSAISTSLLVSSCTKLFPILLVIWPTEAKEGDSFGFAFRATNYVGWVVLLNNVEALLILLNCGYVIATSLAVSGVLARFAVEGWILSLIGLGTDTGPVGDLLVVFSYIRSWLEKN